VRAIIPFPTRDPDPEIEFAEQFAKLQGKFIFLRRPSELVAQLNTLVSSRSWKKYIAGKRN